MNLYKPTTRLWISSISIRSSGNGCTRLTGFIHPRWNLPLTVSSRSLTGCPRFLSTSSTPDKNDDEYRKHVKIYKLEGETMDNNKSGVKIVTDTEHILYTDLPKKMGGKNTAPQPVETMLAAWMGCTQATALFVGRQMKPNRLLIDRLVFENIQGERDERGALTLPIDENPPVPSRLTRVSGRIAVYRAKGESISQEELDLLREQTELRCPVANMMIASGCQMNVEWVCGNPN
eukprot:scaffold2657_cov89-Amphora_coffeaeformis.AAC.33